MPTSIRAALIQSIASLTEEQAHQLVLALGQWADNQRNHVEDSEEVSDSDRAQLAAAEAVVEAGECALSNAANALEKSVERQRILAQQDELSDAEKAELRVLSEQLTEAFCPENKLTDG